MNPTAEAVRARISRRISELDSLELQTTEMSFHEGISRIRNRFLEVDQCILGRIEKKPMTQRSVILWLECAEFMLWVADQEMHSLEKAFRDYGSGVREWESLNPGLGD